MTDSISTMRGKVVVMTGATSGIGRLAAARLAALGARIVFVARDKTRAEDSLAELRRCGGSAEHRAHYANLTRLADMKRVGAEIAAAEPHIDVLINNAGSLFGSRKLTEDGLERTFAVNHMAYFVLTRCLRERLIASAPARIVNTASDAHRGERLDLSDLQMSNWFSGRKAYGRSKLCNILFTRELARRLAPSGVTANCLHPGFVTTNLGQHEAGLMKLGIWLAMRFAGNPEDGARTMVHLANSPEIANVTGAYFHDCQPHKPTAEALDDETGRRLWAESERIAGIS
ncbi:MAG: SDR family NAD(P)-dependent oxidoreductase [Xanthobacteraceae bacterium]